MKSFIVQYLHVSWSIKRNRQRITRDGTKEMEEIILNIKYRSLKIYSIYNISNLYKRGLLNLFLSSFTSLSRRVGN